MQRRAARPGVQPLDTGGAQRLFDRDDLQQVLDLVGQRPETVDHLGRERLDLGRAGKVRHPPVQAEAHVQVRHMGLGDQHRGADVDLRRPDVLGRDDGAALGGAHGGDGLLQHPLVQLESDFLDMPRLFRAQQIAGPADVHVVAGEAEAGAQTVQRLHDRQAFFGAGSRRAGRRDRQIGIGAGLAAADAAPKLVQLR